MKNNGVEFYTAVPKLHNCAQAVAAGIDAMQSRYILGSVAGDDTIIVVSKNAELALESIYRLKDEMSGN